MLALMLCAGLATGPCSTNAEEQDFVVLYRASGPRDRSGGVFSVLAQAGRYDVLARSGILGAYTIADDATAMELEPHRELSPTLRPGQQWAVSPRGTHLGVVSVTGTGANAVTSVAIVGGGTTASPGVHSVQIVEDGNRVLFFETGGSPEEPMRVQVIDVADGPVMEFELEAAGATSFSASGDTVAVAGRGKLAVHRVGRNPLTLPDCRTFHVDASGTRIACANAGEVSLFTLDGTGGFATRTFAGAGPLVAACDLGDHLLLVYPSAGELYDLSSGGRETVLRQRAPRGARFVSGDLRAAAPAPLVALGARLKVVPQMAVPGVPETARADATILVLGAGGQSVLEQPFPMEAWESDHPRVRWTDEGRLLVVARDQALVSQTSFP